MTQPEALRLAESLMDYYKCSDQDIDEAAAELRRQHGEIKSMQAERLRSERRLSAVEAHRDALLEALKKADHFITNGIELGFIRMPDADTPDTAHETPGIVRAAIKAVEGENHAKNL